MNMHMLICFFIFMLVGKEKGEIVKDKRWLLGKKWYSYKDKR
jgi:hypothetical protein